MKERRPWSWFWIIVGAIGGIGAADLSYGNWPSTLVCLAICFIIMWLDPWDGEP